jgi:short-subunit dehydrogenase
MSAFQDEIIWIIGASSGIGAALAKELSGSGAKLAISARRQDALEDLQKDIGESRIYPFDIIDFVAVSNAAKQIFADFGKIDRIIFMAAGYQPMKLHELDLQIAKQIIEINLLGAFHVIDAAMKIFEQQKAGQIVLCGSVAGYIGLPNGQPYSATKAGIINIAESLYAEVPTYIDVKLISPGFVQTQLTDKNNFKMPFIIPPQKAAKYIASGLNKKAFEIHFPKKFTLFLKFLRILPYSLLFWATKRL